MRATCTSGQPDADLRHSFSGYAANSDAITPPPDSRIASRWAVEAPAPAERPADAAILNRSRPPRRPAAGPRYPPRLRCRRPSSPPAEATSAPTQPASSPAVEPTIVASGDLLYVPAARATSKSNSRSSATRRYGSQDLAAVLRQPHGFDALGHKGRLQRRSEKSYRGLQGCRQLGYHATDYKVPDLKAGATGDISPDDLTAAEVSFVARCHGYARRAWRRISDPSAQLSSYLDRKPVLLDRRTFSIRWPRRRTKALIFNRCIRSSRSSSFCAKSSSLGAPRPKNGKA